MATVRDILRAKDARVLTTGPEASVLDAALTMNAVGTVSRRSRVVATTKRPMPRMRSIRPWSTALLRPYLSTPPMIGSRLAMIAIVSAMRWPGMSLGMTWSVMKLGSRIRNRYGFGPPSLMA